MSCIDTRSFQDKGSRGLIPVANQKPLPPFSKTAIGYKFLFFRFPSFSSRIPLKQSCPIQPGLEEMEDYRKSTSSTTSTTSDSNTDFDRQNNTHAVNEIRVATNTTIKRLVDIGLDKLKEHHIIVVTAKGKSINKAISVVEIIKRRSGGTLHQYNQVGKVTSTEEWDPVKDNELDTIAVDTILPVIIIHLSMTAVPELEAIATQVH